MGWDTGQKKKLARDFVREMSGSCRFLTGRMREALLAQEVLDVVRSQVQETLRTADIDNLLACARDEVRVLKGDTFFD